MQTQLEMADAFQQSLEAVGEAQEQLAGSIQADWLSKRLQAQATFTREIAEASGKFARTLLEEA
jgi:phosphodiesterase/alkaline phosphatase D-like protein